MRIFIFFLLSFTILFSAKGQITINNTLYTPSQLVDGVLIPNGSGVTVSNVTFSGVYNSSNRYQVGYFSTATTTLAQMGFSSGVVLSTGNTSDIPLTLGANPQAVAQMSTGYVSCTSGEIRETGTCPTIINDVNILAGTANYYNAAILEFDFIPVGDIVQFRYIFGSEEFSDNSGLINYQCSSYNDQFGFLISGPGISGGQGFTNNARNIARLSNGSQVCINAVNNGVVGSSGGAPSASKCLTANPSWVQGTPSTEYLGTIDGTELNGNTIILTAEQTGLTAGQTYHIKLIITDVNDAAYDAVVYLEAGSFTTVSCSEPAAPTTGSISQPDCTTPYGSIILSGLPSTGNWTITATPGGATLSGSGTNAIFSGLNPSQSYTFTVTNDGGCTSLPSNSISINGIPPNPGAPVLGTISQPSCVTPTGSVDLSGLPSTGTWTVTASPSGLVQGGSGTTMTFTGLNPGTSYTFVVTNSGGCSSNSSVSASINAYSPTPPVVVTISQPDCITPNGSVNLSGLPSNGTWDVVESIGNTTISGSGTSATFSGLNSGTYTFTVIDNIGCPSGPSSSITINPQPSTPGIPLLDTIVQPTCAVNSGSVTLSGLPATGNWLINTTPGGTISGNGTSVVVNGLSPGGTYTFTVTNEDGCTSLNSNAVSINSSPVNPTPPIIGSITQPSCLNPTASVDLSGLPAGNWTITSTPGGLMLNGSGNTVTFGGLSPNTTYSFIVMDNTTLCSSTSSGNATINVYSPTAPIVGLITQPTCNNALGSVELSGLPTSGNWTITSSPGGATFTNSGGSFSFAGLSTGTYSFTVTDDLGCISPSSSSAVIDPQPITPNAPTISNVIQPSCSDNTGSVELTNLPSGNWILTSIPGGTINGSGPSYTISGLTGNSTFTYTITNDEGCISLSSTQVVFNAVPNPPSVPIITNITQPDCNVSDGSVELNGLPSNGLWIVTVTPGGTTLIGSGPTGTFSDLVAGSEYTFTVTDENGCTSLNSTTATINNIPLPPNDPTAVVISQASCLMPTGTIEVITPVGVNYLYSIDGTNFQSSAVFTMLNPGNYTITVLDNNTSCSTIGSSTLTINSVPSPEIITVDADITIVEGQSIQLSANGNGSIIWDNGQTGNTITVSPVSNTVYCATLTDINGCTDTDCIMVIVEAEPIVCGDLFIPTAFSPNGDNNNNSFGVIMNIACIESLDLKVFDRWGELVFETTDPSKRWDGTYKTKELDPAVFVYLVRIKTMEMTQEQTFKGNVTLIK